MAEIIELSQWRWEQLAKEKAQRQALVLQAEVLAETGELRGATRNMRKLMRSWEEVALDVSQEGIGPDALQEERQLLERLQAARQRLMDRRAKHYEDNNRVHQQQILNEIQAHQGQIRQLRLALSQDYRQVEALTAQDEPSSDSVETLKRSIALKEQRIKDISRLITDLEARTHNL
ncbi:MAG: hypothetical protein HQL52_11130 [Magnetococcales bacterium]|nr:hypothetical protein [Magnetococcales bacterium]